MKPERRPADLEAFDLFTAHGVRGETEFGLTSAQAFALAMISRTSAGDAFRIA
jgi:hypothetical protein